MLLRRRALGTKLLAVVAIPLLVVIALMVREVQIAFEDRTTAQEELEEIERQEEISEFADALSEERAVYYNPTVGDADLVEARAEVDEAHQRVQGPTVDLDTSTAAALDAIYAEVVDLRSTLGTSQADITASVYSAGDSGTREAVESYGPLTRNVLDLLSTDDIVDRDALEGLTTLLLLERVAESLATEGILFQQAVTIDTLSEEFVEETESVVAASDEAIQVALSFGQQSVADDVTAYLAGPEWAAYQELRDAVVLLDEDESSDSDADADGESATGDDGDDGEEEVAGVGFDLEPEAVSATQLAVVDYFEDLENIVLARLEAGAEDRAEQALYSLLLTSLIGVLVVSLVTAIVFAIYRAIRTPLNELEYRANEIAVDELPEIVEVMRSEGDRAEIPNIQPIPVETSDEIGRLTDAFNRMHRTAVDLASEQAASRAVVANMFVNLGRRSQKLLMRILSTLNELEAEERNPERLEKLYLVDQLATRMRRNAESLLVLADAGGSRRFDHPVPTSKLIRSAVSEVEDFQRTKLTVVEDALIKGEYVVDLTHLVAELVENGLKFSSPKDDVEIIARYTRVGYILAIVDRGLGLTPDEIRATNEKIAAAAYSTETPSKYLGLFVVGRLAARHGMTVELFEGVPAGLIARVRIPKSMLASEMPQGVLDEDSAQAEPPSDQPRSDQPSSGQPPSDQPPSDQPQSPVPSSGSDAPDAGSPGGTDRPADRRQPDRRQPAPTPGRRPPASSPEELAITGSARSTSGPFPGATPVSTGESSSHQGESSSRPPSVLNAPTGGPPLPPGRSAGRPASAPIAPSGFPGLSDAPGANGSDRPLLFGARPRVAGANLPAGINDEVTTPVADESAYRAEPDWVANSLSSFQRGVAASSADDHHTLSDDEESP